MSPAKVFGIIVRTLGLSLLVYAIWYLTYGVAVVLGMQTSYNYKIGYFLSGSVFLAISLYFLRGAPGLVKYSYPDEK